MDTFATDIYEPLAGYRDEFRDAFRKAASEKFEELVAKSGVDVGENRRLAATVAALEKELARRVSRRNWLLAALWIVGILAALCAGAFAASVSETIDASWALASVVALVALALLLFAGVLPAWQNAKKAVAEAEAALTQARDAAWQQMAPLNALYDWDTVPSIVSKVVPRISFDGYFTEGRLDQLRRIYGFDDAFNANKSVVYSQSGEINGNPFVFGDLLAMRMGQKTYTGSRTVSWPETERGPDGKLRVVRKFETLTASTTKPCPEYSRDRFLLYGNPAAPNLTFSREPSRLSASGDGFFARRALKREIARLEKYSRNLDDDSNYTIMQNREFEALFHAVNRSDEVEFRLLYTPLAQRQTLELLRDREVGFGDDFSFQKDRQVNWIRAEHLSAADIDTDPAKFAHYSVDAARARFTGFAESFFKDAYFALAPLLSIPLYQQTRSHESLHGGSTFASPWEHEALANYYGQARFAHPQSATENILKTAVEGREGGFTQIRVSACGFKIVKRVEVRMVMARNGRFYEVSIPWDDYVPVQRDTAMRLTERQGLARPDFDRAKALQPEEWREFFRSLGAPPSGSRFRRSIVSVCYNFQS